MTIYFLQGLALAHTDNVIDLFVALSDLEWGEFQPVLDYFEQTYIGKVREVPQKRKPGQPKPTSKFVRGKALFPPIKWNHHQRTLDGNARTNNSVEGWNGAIGTALGGKHPNMWKLLGQFQTEALKTLSTAEDISIGSFKKYQNKIYQKNDKAIHTIVSKYDDYDDKIDFLQKIGRHISTFATSAILQSRE